MKNLIVFGMLLSLFACGGNVDKKKTSDAKSVKDTVAKKPEGFKSSHQRDKEEILKQTMKKNKTPVRIKF